MRHERPDVLMLAPKAFIEAGLSKRFTLHRLWQEPDRGAFLARVGPEIRGIASLGGHAPIGPELMGALPKLEIVSSFGVGYDHIDVNWAKAHGVVVTNTPDVLTEEVADTAIGLLLSTVRELPQAERYLRAGRWAKEGDYPLTESLRNRKVGMVGLGRIGKAVARRLDAFAVPVVYHSRRPQAGVSYQHYLDLVAMARDVEILLVITPGGPGARDLIDAEVLKALGPNGILINMSRGSVVDESALIRALQDKTILTAGLDVFRNEPKVPQELLAMDHVVLFPHLGSASKHTRQAMDQLVIDNLVAWASGKPPLTPVPETPWPPSRP